MSVVTLQRCSFSTVASQVRLFPPSHLALLPKKVRLDLLHELPAVDVCRLEEGPVCSDISMEEEVWSVLCNTRLLTYAPSHIISQLEGAGERSHVEVGGNRIALTHREWYLCTVAGCLFANKIDAALSCLFRVNIESANFSADAFSCTELLQVLMTECHFVPPVLHIPCDVLFTSTLWERRVGIFPLLAAFLSCLRHLVISAPPYSPDWEPGESDHKACRFVLEALFLENTGEPALTHLSVSGVDDFMEYVLSFLSDFLSPCSGVVATHAPTPLTTQYDQLQFLSIDIADPLGHTPAHPEPNRDLRLIVEHQQSLKHLCLGGWEEKYYPVCIEYDRLLKSASSLFSRPQFSKLELNMGIYHSTGSDSITLHNVLLDFLSSPFEGQELVLSVWGSSINLDEHAGYSNPACCVVTRNSVGSKHLRILRGRDGKWANALFAEYLSYYPYQSLGELTLEEIERVSDGLLSGIASMNLKALHFRGMDFMATVSIVSVANLFAMPHLTTLSLPGIARTHLMSQYPEVLDVWERLVNAVTLGLRKQQSIGQLTMLDLSSNKLHQLNLKPAYLGQMFDALFFLPQVSSVRLDLRLNRLASSQLQLLCQSWERTASGQRLAELRILTQNNTMQQENWKTLENTNLRKVALNIS